MRTMSTRLDDHKTSGMVNTTPSDWYTSHLTHQPTITTHLSADEKGVAFKTLRNNDVIEDGYIALDEVRTAGKRRNLIRRMTRESNQLLIDGPESELKLLGIMQSAKSCQIGLKRQHVVVV